MDVSAFGVDFHAIRNVNEDRVIACMDTVLGEFPDFTPTPVDIEDIYALALNMLPARYVQSVSLVFEEPVTDEMIRCMVRKAVGTVQSRPNL